MSKPKWNEEPWYLLPYETSDTASIHGDTLVCCTVRRADAARIVSCINACTGIENPEAIPELIAALEEAIDGLATAAEALGNCLEERCIPTPGEVSSCQAYLDGARTALAKSGRRR